MREANIVSLVLTGLLCLAAQAQVTLDTPGLRWTIAAQGQTTSLVEKDTGRELCVAPAPVFALTTEAGAAPATVVTQTGDAVAVTFADGSTCRFTVKTGRRCVILKLADLQAKTPWKTVTLCRVQVPSEGKFAGTLNAWRGPEQSVAVMGLSPQVATSSGVGKVGDKSSTGLGVQCVAQYGIDDAGFGLLACKSVDLPLAIEELELLGGIPSPHFRGQWNKTSVDVKRSYLSVADMTAADTEQVIAFARRCGFGSIFIRGDGSVPWCASLGHYEVNPKAYPGGLPELKATVDKIHAAGFRCWLHLLAPSISVHDSYVTPVPDDRLVMDAQAELAVAIDEKTPTIPVTAKPVGFPEKEGGYLGDSSILRIGNELIIYTTYSGAAPYEFVKCQRGAFGTKAAAHARGSLVRHVKRSYLWFLHDADTTLTAEVAGNLGRVVRATGADCVYFDGSESLQGPHWHYQPKLHLAYWKAFGRDDMLLQASSVSHFSWHMLSRHASADGYGDVKGYLDKRLPSFSYYSDNLLPLDIGWYTIGAQTTPDQVEYICQKALAFGASVSFNLNPWTLAHHPRLEEMVPIIRSYEDLRLAGTVPEAMRAKLRAPGAEYRLAMENGAPVFRRVVYMPEVTVGPGDTNPHLTVTVDPKLGTGRLGVEVKMGPPVTGGAGTPGNGWMLEDFEDLTPYMGKPGTEATKLVIGPNQAGQCSEGVTQTFEAITEGARVGRRCGKYTATSTRKDGFGWSSIGRAIDPPLDLREHVAIGLWVHGDGSGAVLKIQPRDANGNAQDHYFPIIFTGWRYVVLRRPEKPSPMPIVYDKVSRLILYYNGLPAGKTCTVLIDGIEALRTLDGPRTSPPEFTLGGNTLGFAGQAGLDDVLEYVAGDRARLTRADGKVETVAVTGALGALPAGESEIAVSLPESGAGKRVVTVRPMVIYDE